MNQNMLNANSHGDHYGFTAGEKPLSSLGSTDMNKPSLTSDNNNNNNVMSNTAKPVGVSTDNRVPFDPYGAKPVKTENEDYSSYNEHNIYGKNKNNKKEFNESERREAMEASSINVKGVLTIGILIIVVILVAGIVSLFI